MSNHPLDRDPGSNTAADRPRADSLRPDSHDALDQRIMRALEAAPPLDVPANFAARLAARLPEQTPALDPVTLSATHYGRSAILVSLAVLLAAMLILAAHAASHITLEAILEWTLCAQFVALTIWFTTSRKGAN